MSECVTVSSLSWVLGHFNKARDGRASAKHLEGQLEAHCGPHRQEAQGQLLLPFWMEGSLLIACTLLYCQIWNHTKLFSYSNGSQKSEIEVLMWGRGKEAVYFPGKLWRQNAHCLFYYVMADSILWLCGRVVATLQTLPSSLCLFIVSEISIMKNIHNEKRLSPPLSLWRRGSLACWSPRLVLLETPQVWRKLLMLPQPQPPTNGLKRQTA